MPTGERVESPLELARKRVEPAPSESAITMYLCSVTLISLMRCDVPAEGLFRTPAELVQVLALKQGFEP